MNRPRSKPPTTSKTDAVEYKTAPRLEPRPLPPGADPRPDGPGWILVDYSWNEKTGIGRLVYRRRWDPKERVVVNVEQPTKDHDTWRLRPPIDHDAVLGRYFEALHVTMAMQEVGAYGR